MIGQKRYLRALVLLEWFALIAQFILQQQNSVTDRGESLITLGYSQVLINTLLLIFVFVLFSLLFVILGKRKKSHG
jgi:hypothetical protein